jgi:hypothetical protein
LKVILPGPEVLFSPPFLEKYSNYESVNLVGISEESTLGRGMCARFIVVDLYELHLRVLLREINHLCRPLRRLPMRSGNQFAGATPEVKSAERQSTEMKRNHISDSKRKKRKTKRRK